MDELKENLIPALTMNNGKDEVPEPIKASKNLYLEMVTLNENKSKTNPSPITDIENYEEASSNQEVKKENFKEQPLDNELPKKKLDFDSEVNNEKVQKLPIDQDNFSHLLLEFEEKNSKPNIKYIKCLDTYEGKLKQPCLIKFITENIRRKNQHQVTFQLFKKMEFNYSTLLKVSFFKMKMRVKVFNLFQKRFEYLKLEKEFYKKKQQNCLDIWRQKAISLTKMVIEMKTDQESIPIKISDSFCKLKGNEITKINTKYKELTTKKIKEDSHSIRCKLRITLQGKLFDLVRSEYDHYHINQLIQFKDDTHSEKCLLKLQLTNNTIEGVTFQYNSSKRNEKLIKEDKIDLRITLPIQLHSKSFEALFKNYHHAYLKQLKTVYPNDPTSPPLIITSNSKPNQFDDINKQYNLYIKKKSIQMLTDDHSTKCINCIQLKSQIIQMINEKYYIFNKKFKLENPDINPYMNINKPDDIEMIDGFNLNSNEMSSIIQQYYTMNTQHVFRKISNADSIRPMKLNNTGLLIIPQLKIQLIKDKPIYRQYVTDKESDRMKSTAFKHQPLIKDINQVYKEKYYKPMINYQQMSINKQLPCFIYSNNITNVIHYYQTHYLKSIKCDKESEPLNHSEWNNRLDELIENYSDKYIKQYYQDEPDNRFPLPHLKLNRNLLDSIIRKFNRIYIKTIANDYIQLPLNNIKLDSRSLKQLTTDFLYDHPIPRIRTVTNDCISLSIEYNMSLNKNKRSQLKMINYNYYHHYPKWKTISRDIEDNRMNKIMQVYPLLSSLNSKCNHYYQFKYLKVINEDIPDSLHKKMDSQKENEESKITLEVIANHYNQYYNKKFKHSIINDKHNKPLKLNLCKNLHSLIINKIETFRISMRRFNSLIIDTPSNRIIEPKSKESINGLWNKINNQHKEANIQVKAFISNFISLSNLLNSKHNEKNSLLINNIKQIIIADPSISKIKEQIEISINDNQNNRFIDFIPINKIAGLNSNHFDKMRKDILENDDKDKVSEGREGEVEVDQSKEKEEVKLIESDEPIQDDENSQSDDLYLKQNNLLTKLKPISSTNQIIITINKRRKKYLINKEMLERIIRLSAQSNIDLVQFKTAIKKPSTQESIQIKKKEKEEIIAKSKGSKEQLNSLIRIIKQIKQKHIRQSLNIIKCHSDNSINIFTGILIVLLESIIDNGYKLSEGKRKSLIRKLNKIDLIRFELLSKDLDSILKINKNKQLIGDLLKVINLTFTWLMKINEIIGFKTNAELDLLINYYLQSTQSLGKLKTEYLNESIVKESIRISPMKNTAIHKRISKSNTTSISTWAEENTEVENSIFESKIKAKKDKINKIYRQIDIICSENNQLSNPLQDPASNNKIPLLIIIIIFLIAYALYQFKSFNYPNYN